MMSWRRVRLAMVLCALGPALGAARQERLDGVTVTFIANEGVMLSSGDKKVLIDALFHRYKSYAIAPESVQTALATARAPFDDVDAILVTHEHGDHFHPAPVVAHMLANPRAALLASEQVIGHVRTQRPPSGVAARFHARTTPSGVRRTVVINGVSIEVLGMRHHDVEHLGYIVDIGGRRVLHVGDTDDPESAFAPFRLDTARIDVALVPAGMVGDAAARRAIERWIKPKHLAAIHLPEQIDAETRRLMQAAPPGTTFFSRPLETKRW
jgi:L-ascorbate metabolism protein UlaG (beta-lactamase superfamily)